MKIDGHFTFENISTDAVWSFLTDADRIALCLPGCEALVPAVDGSYEMTMSVGIGAIRGKFSGAIRLHDVHPTTDYAMTVSGSGAPGFVNGVGSIHLTTQDDGTHLTYSGDVSAGEIGRAHV